MDGGPKTTTVPKTKADIQEFINGLKDYNHYIGMIAPYRPGVKLCINRIEYELYTPDTPANDLLHLHILNWADGLWALLSVPKDSQAEIDTIAEECGVKAKRNHPCSISSKGFESFPVTAENLFCFENTPGHPVYTNNQKIIEAIQVQEQERTSEIIDKHYQNYQE